MLFKLLANNSDNKLLKIPIHSIDIITSLFFFSLILFNILIILLMIFNFFVTGYRRNVAKEPICKAKQKQKRGSPNQHRPLPGRSTAGKTAHQLRFLLRPIKEQDHQIIKHVEIFSRNLQGILLCLSHYSNLSSLCLSLSRSRASDPLR